MHVKTGRVDNILFMIECVPSKYSRKWYLSICLYFYLWWAKKHNKYIFINLKGQMKGLLEQWGHFVRGWHQKKSENIFYNWGPFCRVGIYFRKLMIEKSWNILKPTLKQQHFRKFSHFHIILTFWTVVQFLTNGV